MREYEKELEDLISNVLLPVYIEHYRLLGRPSPKNEINQTLLDAMHKKRQIPFLLKKQSYGR